MLGYFEMNRATITFVVMYVLACIILQTNIYPMTPVIDNCCVCIF